MERGEIETTQGQGGTGEAGTSLSADLGDIADEVNDDDSRLPHDLAETVAYATKKDYSEAAYARQAEGIAREVNRGIDHIALGGQGVSLEDKQEQVDRVLADGQANVDALGSRYPEINSAYNGLGPLRRDVEFQDRYPQAQEGPRAVEARATDRAEKLAHWAEILHNNSHVDPTQTTETAMRMMRFEEEELPRVEGYLAKAERDAEQFEAEKNGIPVTQLGSWAETALGAIPQDLGTATESQRKWMDLCSSDETTVAQLRQFVASELASRVDELKARKVEYEEGLALIKSGGWPEG